MLPRSAIAFLLLSACPAFGQDLTGLWQGTLQQPKARIALDLHKTPDGWLGRIYVVDQSPKAVAARGLQVQEGSLRFEISAIHATFQGKIVRGMEGSDILEGTLTTGSGSKPPQNLRFTRVTSAESAWVKPSPMFATRYITVDREVRLEVASWGDRGRPLILLAGLGGDVHSFEDFGPRLAASPFRVFAISRRGFGRSSVPASGYGADRLGDDVAEVIRALNLNEKPVLIGHSIGGQELSAVAERHRELIAGVVYLDSYAYAAYSDQSPNAPARMWTDLVELRKKLDKLLTNSYGKQGGALAEDLLRKEIPALNQSLQAFQQEWNLLPAKFREAMDSEPASGPAQAILEGSKRYRSLNVPALAILAIPHDIRELGLQEGSVEFQAMEQRDAVNAEAQAKAFETVIPQIRIVRIPKASHFVHRSHEAEVLREIRAFSAALR